MYSKGVILEKGYYCFSYSNELAFANNFAFCSFSSSMSVTNIKRGRLLSTQQQQGETNNHCHEFTSKYSAWMLSNLRKGTSSHLPEFPPRCMDAALKCLYTICLRKQREPVMPDGFQPQQLLKSSQKASKNAQNITYSNLSQGRHGSGLWSLKRDVSFTEVIRLHFLVQ